MNNTRFLRGSGLKTALVHESLRLSLGFSSYNGGLRGFFSEYSAYSDSFSPLHVVFLMNNLPYL